MVRKCVLILIAVVVCIFVVRAFTFGIANVFSRSIPVQWHGPFTPEDAVFVSRNVLESLGYDTEEMSVVDAAFEKTNRPARTSNSGMILWGVTDEQGLMVHGVYVRMDKIADTIHCRALKMK